MQLLWKYLWLMPVFAFLTCQSDAAADSSKAGLIPLARCRARCLSKFLKGAINNEGCKRDTHCTSCWSVCETLFNSYAVWKDICDKRDTCSGCQVACQFKKTLSNSAVVGTWKFTEIPAVTTESILRRAYMAWNQPVLMDAHVDTHGRTKSYIVYVLLVRDLTKAVNHWEQVLQSASTEANLDLSALPYNPEFWLIAISENGTMAEIRFNVSVSQHLPYRSERIDISDKDDLRDVQGAVFIKYPNSTLNLTMYMTFKDGRIVTSLTWTNPQFVQTKELVYLIDYYRNHCECELPEDHIADKVVTGVMQQPEYTFHEIAFSAEYHVEVQLKSDKTWHGEITFNTPKCRSYQDPTVCLEETNTKQTFITKSATDTTIIEHLDHPSVQTLDWNITNIGMEYDYASRLVFVYLNWSMPFNYSKGKVDLMYSNGVHTRHVDAGRKEIKTKLDSAYEVLKLQPDGVYELYVAATYTDDSGTQKEVRSNRLQVYTNETERMSAVQAARLSLIEQEKDILNGIILGVTVVSSIIIFGIIVIIVYKKRQSFRDIIITKTAVAKSNSYKSDVGCKVDYSNEMLITGDEWEIDCKQLKFASHIGHGAFGKVVIGYYQDQRVAIKLVRDCAPMSYKEDLLAEISLMKRIGSHPNIVSMVGACTLTEPISLVMEFVPFGSLLTFLRKFRTEGEITVQAGLSHELNYSIADDQGGITEGVIKPTDLLSFARQVAMAMEYLAEKKYVHRDLAARNVLLGYDKVIKLCDFGLSRDIFGNSQYKKLTNGKLPLKWMAIESLKDRVFTNKSDVWSFGILLWEIVTLGSSPYPGVALADLYYLLSNSYRMEKPSNCSDELYTIMRQCWLEDPSERPNFTDLRVQLELFLTRDCNYLELDNINVPLSTPESSSGSPAADDTKSLLATKALPTQKKNSTDELTANVSVHVQSVQKLLRLKGDFDCHDITIL